MIVVDPIFRCLGPRGNDRWCHCGTDIPTEAGVVELKEFGERLGMNPRWIQGFENGVAGDHPHFDLYPSKRALAVKLGAFEVGSTEEYSRLCSWPRRIIRMEAALESARLKWARYAWSAGDGSDPETMPPDLAAEVTRLTAVIEKFKAIVEGRP